MDRWTAEHLRMLFAELVTQDGLLYSRRVSEWSPERPLRNSMPGRSSRDCYCPNLLLKRRLLYVQILSASGEHELVMTRSSGGWRRLTSRLKEKTAPLVKAMDLLTSELCTPEEWVKALGWHTLSNVESTPYPGLEGERIHYVVQLSIADLPPPPSRFISTSQRKSQHDDASQHLQQPEGFTSPERDQNLSPTPEEAGQQDAHWGGTRAPPCTAERKDRQVDLGVTRSRRRPGSPTAAEVFLGQDRVAALRCLTPSTVALSSPTSRADSNTQIPLALSPSNTLLPSPALIAPPPPAIVPASGSPMGRHRASAGPRFRHWEWVPTCDLVKELGGIIGGIARPLASESQGPPGALSKSASAPALIPRQARVGLGHGSSVAKGPLKASLPADPIARQPSHRHTQPTARADAVQMGSWKDMRSGSNEKCQVNTQDQDYTAAIPNAFMGRMRPMTSTEMGTPLASTSRTPRRMQAW
mmetsp:Transcript_49122/g.128220  ORF Transcript_49122/g.128220 Transcript_49122/m.128220 type:complete len:471 (-) Transcript_49122:289-1701(-)